MKWPTLILIPLLIAATAPLSCRQKSSAKDVKPPVNAYGSEPDWNNPQQLLSLNYQQTQGQRIFYNNCVWCHASSTPAGPSNISNLNPAPPLANDGATLNSLSDDYLQNMITLGGSAMSKSAMMPPWGRTLKQDEIRAVLAFIRAIAQPPYQLPARTSSQYSEK